VIMAVDDLDSIEATIELLRDPAAQRRVTEATAEIERGEWLDEAAVRAMVRGQRPTRFESLAPPRARFPSTYLNPWPQHVLSSSSGRWQTTHSASDPHSVRRSKDSIVRAGVNTGSGTASMTTRRSCLFSTSITAVMPTDEQGQRRLPPGIPLT
jgi:hypothetical protein